MAQWSTRIKQVIFAVLDVSYLQRSFLLLVTAASDLLVHKIILNSVLLFPIVSSGVWPTPHPRTNTPRS